MPCFLEGFGFGRLLRTRPAGSALILALSIVQLWVWGRGLVSVDPCAGCFVCRDASRWNNVPTARRAAAIREGQGYMPYCACVCWHVPLPNSRLTHLAESIHSRADRLYLHVHRIEASVPFEVSSQFLGSWMIVSLHIASFSCAIHATYPPFPHNRPPATTAGPPNGRHARGAAAAHRRGPCRESGLLVLDAPQLGQQLGQRRQPSRDAYTDHPAVPGPGPRGDLHAPGDQRRGGTSSRSIATAITASPARAWRRRRQSVGRARAGAPCGRRRQRRSGSLQWPGRGGLCGDPRWYIRRAGRSRRARLPLPAAAGGVWGRRGRGAAAAASAASPAARAAARVPSGWVAARRRESERAVWWWAWGGQRRR